MKAKGVKPLRTYRAPAYPTGCEIGAIDLSRVPARWRGLKAVASTLGAAAMSLKALALEAQEATKPVSTAPVVSVPETETPKAVVAQEKVVTEVCPLPTKEIAGDGAGAFGCVAMNPPVILPEGEALEIIEKEFAKRGLRLEDCPALEGIDAPKKDWMATLDAAERRRINHRLEQGLLPDVPRERRRLMLDFATADGSLVVEYVSRMDARDWVHDPYRGSTVSLVQTRLGAAEVVRTLRTRTEGKPMKVGVFYDPCAKSTEIARQKLIAQIEHFFEYLAKNPVK